MTPLNPLNYETLANHIVDQIATPEHRAAFVALGGLADAEEVRAMVVRALRFASFHDVTLPRDLPKSTT